MTSHLPDDPAHGRPHHESLTDKNMRLLVLPDGNPKKRRSMLDVFLRQPRHEVACFPPLILIGLNDKSLTLFLLKKASLILLNV
jgi:hypothetical protein